MNSFPNQPHTAEVEYIARFKRVAERLGHVVAEVVTSDDINLFDPDFVVATHFFSPKLTPHLTLGAMWNPPDFFQGDTSFLDAILSYDGYLIGSDPIRTFLAQLEAERGVSRPKSDFTFLPFSPSRILPQPEGKLRDLVYVGVHWDGLRHGGLFSRLDGSGCLNLYGPRGSWTHCPRSYRGQIPFDGESVFRALSQHGIALCLHKEEHWGADTPSARLFEAAASGCLLITDGIPFAKRVLGDAAFHLEFGEPEDNAAARILEIVAWARSHPDLADAMAAKSHAILDRDYCLERAVERCCNFASALAERDEARATRAYALSGAPRAGTQIDILLQAAGRKRADIEAVLGTLAAQEGGPYRVLLIGGEPELGDLGLPGAAALIIEPVPAGNCSVEAALRTGLGRVTAPFFTLMDADDRPTPNHFSSQLQFAGSRPAAGLIESVAVRIGAPEPRLNLVGALGRQIPERRELVASGSASSGAESANCAPANAWIARSSLIEGDRLAIAAEQAWKGLYGWLCERASRASTYRPTLFGADFADPHPDRRALGRALVKERARCLVLERALFEAECRARDAEHEASVASAKTEHGASRLAALAEALDQARIQAESLTRSRLLRAIGWASRRPIQAAHRITSALAEASMLLQGLRDP